MSHEEQTAFEKKLAFHAAPTLMGIKCGALFSLSSKDFDIDENISLFNKKAVKKKLKIRTFCPCGERKLIFVYKEDILLKRISEENTKRLLINFGYDVSSIDKALNKLSERIKCTENFPHEIGAFLDYPACDIYGFIENKGENYKLCGYRKVYGDVDKAKKTFIIYDKCRKFLCDKLNQGTDLYSVLSNEERTTSKEYTAFNKAIAALACDF